MQDIYLVKPVSCRDALLAYPLVQAVAPTIAMDRWERFCRGLDQAGDSELLGVFDEYGHIRGIASAGLVDHAEYGPTLHVPMFIVLSLANPGGVVSALIAALRTRASAAAAANILVTTDTLDARQQLLAVGSAADKKTVRISAPGPTRH